MPKALKNPLLHESEHSSPGPGAAKCKMYGISHCHDYRLYNAPNLLHDTTDVLFIFSHNMFGNQPIIKDQNWSIRKTSAFIRTHNIQKGDFSKVVSDKSAHVTLWSIIIFWRHASQWETSSVLFWLLYNHM